MFALFCAAALAVPSLAVFVPNDNIDLFALPELSREARRVAPASTTSSTGAPNAVVNSIVFKLPVAQYSAGDLAMFREEATNLILAADQDLEASDFEIFFDEASSQLTIVYTTGEAVSTAAAALEQEGLTLEDSSGAKVTVTASTDYREKVDVVNSGSEAKIVPFCAAAESGKTKAGKGKKGVGHTHVHGPKKGKKGKKDAKAGRKGAGEAGEAAEADKRESGPEAGEVEEESGSGMAPAKKDKQAKAPKKEGKAVEEEDKAVEEEAKASGSGSDAEQRVEAVAAKGGKKAKRARRDAKGKKGKSAEDNGSEGRVSGSGSMAKEAAPAKEAKEAKEAKNPEDKVAKQSGSGMEAKEATEPDAEVSSGSAMFRGTDNKKKHDKKSKKKHSHSHSHSTSAPTANAKCIQRTLTHSISSSAPAAQVAAFSGAALIAVVGAAVAAAVYVRRSRTPSDVVSETSPLMPAEVIAA